MLRDVLPLAVFVAVTLVDFFGLTALFRGRRPILAAASSAVLAPLLLLLLAAVFLFSPNPQHRDGPGMGFAACILSELFAIPLGLATSTAAFFAVRRRKP